MHLTKAQLEQLKGQLLESQEKLRGVLDSLNKTDPTTDNDRLNENADLGDEATEDRELMRHESLQSESEIMLRRVEEALGRMTDGSYGHTLEGEAIPFNRLQADPTVTTLVK